MRAIAAGSAHCVAVTDGEVVWWSPGHVGRVQLATSWVAAGLGYTVVQTVEGEVRQWSVTDAGSTPTGQPSTRDAVQVAAGAGHALVLMLR